MGRVMIILRVGTMTYSNGDMYDGNWREDKRDGEGIFHL